MKNFILILRLIAAVILLQTLYFKFSGASESVYIFKTLHAEPFGRWFAGFSELVAAILLLTPRTQILGALMACGVMFGAIASHIFVLGVVVQDDGGLLFGMGIFVFICSALVVVLGRDQWSQTPFLGKFVK